MWLNLFFHNAYHRPWLVRCTKPFFMWGTWHGARATRRATLANARWLLGSQSTPNQRRRLARAVLADFYDFVSDIGRFLHLSPQQLRRQIGEVHGHERYVQVRARRRGAILLTAHLGSFEVGVAALKDYEARMHVVYHRDLQGRFEQLRSEQRRRLGVVQWQVEDGLSVWLNLRDALLADEVVLIQGDRVMPGQKGVAMPFLGGHMMMPAGPVKLAIATGAPIIPVFSVRQPDGRVSLFLEEPILVETQHQRVNAQHPAMVKIAATIARYVHAYPEQWHMICRAWCEDQSSQGDSRE